MEATPDALGAIGTYLATRGVGRIFPTTVTSPRDETMRSLADWRLRSNEHGSSSVVGYSAGIHLKGHSFRIRSWIRGASMEPPS